MEGLKKISNSLGGTELRGNINEDCCDKGTGMVWKGGPNIWQVMFPEGSPSQKAQTDTDTSVRS
jgi:hypothetical protein